MDLKKVDEVILGHNQLSRIGQFDDDSLILSLEYLKSCGVKTVLEWDVLMTEEIFNKKCTIFDALKSSKIDAVRVLDVGALNYVLKNTKLPIQMVVENTHNLVAIKKWSELLKHRLDRLILSRELDKFKVMHFLNECDCDMEVLAFGPMILSYTERQLLDELRFNKINIHLKCHSTEGQRKEFNVIQNIHGTMILHHQNVFILDEYLNLNKLKNLVFLIDFRFIDDQALIGEILDYLIVLDEKKLKKILISLKETIFKGLWDGNKNDTSFIKPKNIIVNNNISKFLGTIIEAKKGEYLAIQVKNEKHSIKRGMKFRFITPERKVKKIEIENIMNSSFKNIDKISYNDLIFIKHISGITSKTAVYIDRNSKK